MTKYAIVFPGDTIKKFDDFTIEVLKEANDGGCNIFEEAGPSEFKAYKSLVLHSLIPLDTSVLKPSRVYGEYTIYDFPGMVGQYDYREFRDFLLSVHPTAKEVKYHPAPGFIYEDKVIEPGINPISSEQYKELSLYYKRYNALLKEITTGTMMDANDIRMVEDIQKMISVRHVMEKLGLKLENYYYPYIDRVISPDIDTPIGDAITFAFLACRKSMQDTKKFFITHFNIPFKLFDELEYESELSSRTISEGEGFMSNGFCYISEDKKITDFMIRVKYCMELQDLGKRYIVDLIGTDTVEGVEFPSVFTKSQFKQKISHFGNFHFMGGDAHINMLHKAVSNTTAPEIKPLLGFGFHKQILAMENCVFDMEKKVVYEREGNYFFNRDLREGYTIVDARGTNLLVTMQGLPQLVRGTPNHTTDEYMDYFSQFYRDTTGAFLFLYTLGLIYAGVYRHLPDFKFPYLILNGKYGSGKSAISDMIKRVYCIRDLEKGQTKYGETTPFSFLNLCSYRTGLPLFITEFKEQNEEKGDAKVSNLISMYDRAVVSKGTASQDMIYYYLNALGVIDGEELPKRSAFKSRSVILYVDAKNNALGVSEYKKKLADPILTHLFADCIDREHYEADYKEYIHEGMKFFEGKFPEAHSRLIEGFAGIYAGCRMFDSTIQMKESVEFYLLDRFEWQMNLEKDTYGTGECLDIIKRYARQLSANDVYYYDRSEKRFCLRIGQFETFIHRHHIKLSLGFEALRGYFPLVEDIEDTMGGLIECAVWPMDKHFPKQLLFCAEAYDDYKLLMKQNEIHS